MGDLTGFVRSLLKALSARKLAADDAESVAGAMRSLGLHTEAQGFARLQARHNGIEDAWMQRNRIEYDELARLAAEKAAQGRLATAEVQRRALQGQAGAGHSRSTPALSTGALDLQADGRPAERKRSQLAIAA